ncbi:MAG: type 1 glutamine amidotransferase domain-containing protein [Myxococcota bacterium]|nr:type 1 glutamine amidotransferase domain-containing protein [Myxococcota bacterium]
MARVLVPLPDRDFDTTEAAVPWAMLRDAGHQVVFATEQGAVAACDPLLLTGVIFGQLGADPGPIQDYQAMSQDPAFLAPLRWSELQAEDYDGLLLPGGHAPGMRQYLGSELLQAFVARFWATGRPVAAICHGVLLLARSKDTQGRSVLRGTQTTCLPAYMEYLAWGLTAWKLGRYYRTYPESVQAEVCALTDPSDFRRGPLTLGTRGTADSDRGAFVVQDGRYVSARWPGDAYLFGRTFLSLVEQSVAARNSAGSAPP